jgi:hypothetical protein
MYQDTGRRPTKRSLCNLQDGKAFYSIGIAAMLLYRPRRLHSERNVCNSKQWVWKGLGLGLHSNTPSERNTFVVRQSIGRLLYNQNSRKARMSNNRLQKTQDAYIHENHTFQQDGELLLHSPEVLRRRRKSEALPNQRRRFRRIPSPRKCLENNNIWSQHVR